MISAPHVRLGRNELCWCGSGRKYKVCHLEEDRAAEQAQREQEAAEHAQGPEADHRCAPYRPGTRKVPAVQRPDFITTVRNLASAGEGAWLHIDGPVDLGRDQASVDSAIQYLRRQGVLPDFRLDPEPPVVAATQDLLDRMSGRGVFTVVPSGVRLRKYGQTEITATPDGSSFVAYLSGARSLSDVVHLLVEATAIDARTLGVSGGLLADVWPVARVAREIVVNHLALPQPLLDRADELVEALIERISSRAEVLERGSASSEAVLAQSTLPYLVGLREAVVDSQGQLDGMGLSARSIEMLSVQIEAAANRSQWLHRVAELAADEWDTPEGYSAWIDGARSVPEVARLLDSSPFEAPDHSGETPASTERARTPAAPATASAYVGTLVAHTDTAVGSVPLISTVPGRAGLSQTPMSIFADVDRVTQDHAVRRQEIHERLTGVLDRHAEVARERGHLEEQLRALENEQTEIDQRQAEVTAALEAEAEAEARARHQSIVGVLSRGAAALDQAAAAWSEAVRSAAGREDATIAQAERIVGEYHETVRRGLIEQLPAGIRDKVEQDVEQARGALRALLGGRDPLILPAVVTALEQDSALTLSIGLPLLGSNELAPGSLHTAVAVAFADVIADTVRSMTQIDLASVDHVQLPEGASVLRLRFSGPPPITAEDCAQYVALNVTDIGQRNPALRQAGVSIEARVEPDLEMDV